MLKRIKNVCRDDFDILVDSFVEDIDLRTITNFPMISIYGKPKDYPGKYVARVFDVRPGEVSATRYIMVSENLEELRNAMPSGFSPVGKTPEDDPDLLEVWF